MIYSHSESELYIPISIVEEERKFLEIFPTSYCLIESTWRKMGGQGFSNPGDEIKWVSTMLRTVSSRDQIVLVS